MIDIVWYTLLCIGGFGLLTQLFLGGHYGHHSPGSSTHHISSAVPGRPTVGTSTSTHRLASAKSPKEGKGNARSLRMTLLLSVISPLTIFSVCLGTGATGLLLGNAHLTKWVDIAASVIGGIVFYAAAIRPLMGLLLNFASTPSKALEGALSQNAEVISHFDASGRGMVNITIDGQIIRVLAILEESDRPLSAQIIPGDRLLVTHIDGRRNACRVSKI